MTRLCGQCGYDVTSVPVRPGGRHCPECGEIGRGVRPVRGFRPGRPFAWWVWEASRRFIVRFGGAVVCLGILKAWNPTNDWGLVLMLAAMLLLVWAAVGGYLAWNATAQWMSLVFPPGRKLVRIWAVLATAMLVAIAAAVLGVVAVGSIE